MIVSLNAFFWLVGMLLFVIGGIIVSDRTHPKRFLAGGFWIVCGVIFLAGDRIPADIVGVLVILMAVVPGVGGVTSATPKTRPEEARRGRRLRPRCLRGCPGRQRPPLRRR